MSSIFKKYVDLTGLGTFKTQMANLVDSKISAIANFTGASASTAGASGKVPAPAAGDQNKFLRGDGAWAVSDVFVGTHQEWENVTNKAAYRLVAFIDD